MFVCVKVSCIAVLQRALAVPVHSESSPFIMPVGEVALTPLQEAILSAIQVLHTVSAPIFLARKNQGKFTNKFSATRLLEIGVF